ncbi:MAG: protein-L-isoaspartate O-methyltransferase [Candidatus Omnitrophota bacterium]
MMKKVLAALCAAAVSSCVFAQQADDYARRRGMMVDSQVISRGIKDARITGAIDAVERHKFVPEGMREYAYDDISLPVGEDEAIPPAYFVALVARMADLKARDKVLIIGVEGGYQAAVFSMLAGRVYCVESSEKLAQQAEDRLESMGCRNVHIKSGQVTAGWLERAPFEVIVITNQMDYAPRPVIEQLMMNGKLIMPLREYAGKKLIVLTKVPDKDGKGYRLSGTFVGPFAGENPVDFNKKVDVRPEGKKWISGKDGKWMKKNK